MALTITKLMEMLEPQTDNTISPADFADVWITKLYGLQPDSTLYKRACIQEFCRFLKIKPNTAYSNWVWERNKPEETYYFDKDLPSILWLMHSRYMVMEAVGCLPRYIVNPQLLDK